MTEVREVGEGSYVERDGEEHGFTGTKERRTVLGVQVPVWLRPGGRAWIWLGVGCAVFGFGLIAVTWSLVAAETKVYLQVPYLVSGGFSGLALILSGLTILNVVTRDRDAIERERQIDDLVGVITEVRDLLSEQQEGGG